jgi:hypothetical protein
VLCSRNYLYVQFEPKVVGKLLGSAQGPEQAMSCTAGLCCLPALPCPASPGQPLQHLHVADHNLGGVERLQGLSGGLPLAPQLEQQLGQVVEARHAGQEVEILGPPLILAVICSSGGGGSGAAVEAFSAGAAAGGARRVTGRVSQGTAQCWRPA